MKNIFLKKVVQLIQKFIPKHEKKNRFLIVSTTALGDTLWGTAAIENLKRSYPTAYIALLTSPIGVEVFEKNPYINKIVSFKEPLSKKLFSLWKTLYKKKFDTVLLFHASQRLTLPLCSLLGAQKIVGTAGINKGLDALLTDPLPNDYQHEIVRRCKIVEKVGAQIKTEKLCYFDFEPFAFPTKGPWIALHPGSKDHFKRWPEEKFIELGQKLKAAFPCEILITGSEKEKDLLEKIASNIPNAQLDLTNRSLKSFASLLKKIDLLISNDTGPVHLASAINTPTIAIYSPTNPDLCGPHKAENSYIISRAPTCDPCLKRKCKRPFCFLQISANEVLILAKKILNEKTS